MSQYAANYRVVLRAELPAREAAFFSVLGVEVSFNHPVYLELRVFKEPETWLLPVFVPHERVLMVFGRTDEAFPLASG